jgi:signal transduction histidine kinase
LIAEKREGRVRVKVVDHGPGIPDEFRARLFQKFSQADTEETKAREAPASAFTYPKRLSSLWAAK